MHSWYRQWHEARKKLKAAEEDEDAWWSEEDMDVLRMAAAGWEDLLAPLGVDSPLKVCSARQVAPPPTCVPSHPLSPQTGAYEDLTPFQRLLLLKALLESMILLRSDLLCVHGFPSACASPPADAQSALRSTHVREIEPEDLRVEPAGADDQGRVYYFFPQFPLDCRIYRAWWAPGASGEDEELQLRKQFVSELKQRDGAPPTRAAALRCLRPHAAMQKRCSVSSVSSVSVRRESDERQRRWLLPAGPLRRAPGAPGVRAERAAASATAPTTPGLQHCLRRQHWRMRPLLAVHQPRKRRPPSPH